MAIPPDDREARAPSGVLGGDLAGFPNGRRLADDVTDIEVRAIACGYGQILHDLLGVCTNAPNDQLTDGNEANSNENGFLPSFPYVAKPNNGYDHTGHR